MRRDDASEIIAALERDVEGILSKYWSGWQKVHERGVDIALATPRIKTGKDGKRDKKPTSSFRVTLSGSKRGQWYRFSRSIGGGALDLLFYGETGREPTTKDKEYYREAFQVARQFLGLEAQQDDSAARAEREERRKKEAEEREKRARLAAAEKAAYEERRTLNAADVWRGTVPLEGSLGEAYLVERGIPPVAEWPWSPDHTIRFHPALDFEKDRDAGLFPAVVGRVQDEFGSGSSCWQIYLERDAPKKANLYPSPKIGRGPASGGAVRIGGVGPWIGVAEGMESALAGWFLWDCRRPVWACLSTSGMSAFEPPMEVERITIIPDGDRGLLSKDGKVHEPPGLAAARRLQARMKAAGIRCDISEMTNQGDALDLLQVKRRYESKAGSAATSGERASGTNSAREGASV